MIIYHWFECFSLISHSKTSYSIILQQASSIDGEMKGSCPICQQWFMIAYLLAEQKNASFKVFTVQANTPPQTFKDKVQSKIFPVVIGTSGKNVNGQDISGIVYDNYDDVEKFFESINFNCPKLKRTQQANVASLKIFEDLYKVGFYCLLFRWTKHLV